MGRRLIDAVELRLKLDEAYKMSKSSEEIIPGYGAGIRKAIWILDEQSPVKTEATYAVSCIDSVLLDEHPDYINFVKTELAKRVGIQLMEDRLLVFRQQEDPHSRQTGFKASVRVIIPVEEVRNDDCD